jgi:hypothetical protein
MLAWKGTFKNIEVTFDGASDCNNAYLSKSYANRGNASDLTIDGAMVMPAASGVVAPPVPTAAGVAVTSTAAVAAGRITRAPTRTTRPASKRATAV